MGGFKERPCPGCGELSARPVDTLCHRCKQLLAEATETRQRHAQLLASGDVVRRIHNRVARAIPGYYASGLPTEEHERLRSAVWDIVNLMSEEVTGTLTGWYGEKVPPVFSAASKQGGGRDWACVVVMRPEVAHALERFDQAIRSALAACHEAGASKGKSALLSLAEGTVTAEQFEAIGARSR